MRPPSALSSSDRKLRALVRAYVIAALAFMLLPGTFLGVWNLLSLSADHNHRSLSPAWVQAHGHAQIFGWIGSLVIGIGFFSLSKMGPVTEHALRRGWFSWFAWVLGVFGTWCAGVNASNGSALLLCSATLECCGYATFVAIVRQHKPKLAPNGVPVLKPVREPWMKMVFLSSTMFAAALLWHLVACIVVAYNGSGPAFPTWADRTLLGLAAWGFLILSIWAFNARWLSMFGGFEPVDGRKLLWAARLQVAGIVANAFALILPSAILLTGGVACAALALHVFVPANAQKHQRWLVNSVRACYAWSGMASIICCLAAMLDMHGGFTGASRHAQTVGFIGAMVFTIGQRLLPVFCGAPGLFSTRLRNASILLLNVGCFLRVFAEIPAYEFNNALAWRLLPVSAILELSAVAIFATNLLLSLLTPAVQQIHTQRAVA